MDKRKLNWITWAVLALASLAGVALLLVTLALYNKPFEDPKKR